MTPDNLLVSLERKTCKTRFNIFEKWAQNFDICFKTVGRLPTFGLQRLEPKTIGFESKGLDLKIREWQNLASKLTESQANKMSLLKKIEELVQKSKVDLLKSSLEHSNENSARFCLVWKEASGNNGQELEMVRLSLSNTFNELDVQLHHGGM